MEIIMKHKQNVHLNRSMQEIIFVLLLIAVIAVMFCWYTNQNRLRMIERNKTYAFDSAQLKAVQIDNELNNALLRTRTYSYLIGESLAEPNMPQIGRASCRERV